MHLFKMFVLLMLSCIVLAVPAIAMAAENEGGGQYYAAVEVLESVDSPSPSLSIQGYHITICHSAGGYIVIALPKNPEMLGLVRWTNGEIYNLYNTQQPWFSDWPVSFALSRGEKGKAWLNDNDFKDFAPRKFIWWRNPDTVISETLGQGGTISIGDEIYSMLPRWNKDTATKYQLSRELAVL